MVGRRALKWVAGEEAGPGLMSDIFVLTKARLNLMVIITTFVGFCAASGSSLNWLLLANAVLTNVSAQTPRCALQKESVGG